METTQLIKRISKFNSKDKDNNTVGNFNITEENSS